MGREFKVTMCAAQPVIPSSLRIGRKYDDYIEYIEMEEASYDPDEPVVAFPSHIEGNQQVLMKRMFQVRLRRILRAYAQKKEAEEYHLGDEEDSSDEEEDEEEEGEDEQEGDDEDEYAEDVEEEEEREEEDDEEED